MEHKLDQNKLNLYANKILEDYDNNNPSSIFKNKAYDNNFRGKLISFSLKDKNIKNYGSQTDLLKAHGISESKILEKISNKLSETRSQSIFLATDDKKYVDLLRSNFPNKVVSLDHSISLDGSPIHFSGNKNILNREVMKEVIILSRLPHFLYCYSNVSFLALTLGIHFFKSMEVLN